MSSGTASQGHFGEVMISDVEVFDPSVNLPPMEHLLLPYSEMPELQNHQFSGTFPCKWKHCLERL